MTVILVNEDNHGLLTVAKDYKAAVKFLIDNGWIKETTEVWENEQFISLSELLGSEAFDIMTENWNIDKFNDFWMNDFLLEEMEVYE